MVRTLSCPLFLLLLGTVILSAAVSGGQTAPDGSVRTHARPTYTPAMTPEYGGGGAPARVLAYQHGGFPPVVDHVEVDEIGPPWATPPHDLACVSEVCYGGPFQQTRGLCRWSADIDVRGWLDQGFTWNPDSPRNRFNLPVTFNDRANEYEMNQLYLTVERPVRVASPFWNIGGRVDLLYGTDYVYTTAVGLETHQDATPKWNSANGPRRIPTTTGLGISSAALYGLAMPQLYAEISAPILGGMTVKVGHFYTIIGYESVMSPDNFFYSHSYAMQYGEPFTHTGALFDKRLTPSWSLQAGVTRGWNTWEDPNNNLGFLGGLRWTSPNERTSLTFALTTGDEDLYGIRNRTMYSLVFRHELTPCLTYILEHDFGHEDQATLNETDAKWYGINQYLLYKVNQAVSLGMRVEWFRDQNHARVIVLPEEFADGGNFCEVTLGLNWCPRHNIVVRPEVRWDASDTVAKSPLSGPGAYDDFSSRHQFLLATDVILSY